MPQKPECLLYHVVKTVRYNNVCILNCFDVVQESDGWRDRYAVDGNTLQAWALS